MAASRLLALSPQLSVAQQSWACSAAIVDLLATPCSFLCSSRSLCCRRAVLLLGLFAS
jgi:hypothetical protein